MKATIRVINQQKGMYAGEIESSGEFVVFELLDTQEPEVGDIIEHSDFYSMGSETFRNLSQDCGIDVFVEDVCSASMVKKRCLF